MSEDLIIVCDECGSRTFKIVYDSGGICIDCDNCGYRWFGHLNECLKKKFEISLEECSIKEVNDEGEDNE